MNKIITVSDGETILFDDACVMGVDAGLFSPKRDNVSENTLGRGSVYFFEHESLSLVLRHYRRGGLIRHLVQDNYFFWGLDGTRMWREYHLLQKLHSLKLPVPKAVAVRCLKTSPITYAGDLITQCIPNSETLAQVLSRSSITDGQWKELGVMLALFHRQGVFHADLNANNILLDDKGAFYLIDFDRCEMRLGSRSEQWQRSNMERLLRSFIKHQRRHEGFDFGLSLWQLLLKSYEQSGGKGV